MDSTGPPPTALTQPRVHSRGEGLACRRQTQTMHDIAVAAASAFFGALAAFLASLRLARLSERRTVTDQFVNEFYSDGFMIHRTSLSTSRRKLRAGAAKVEEIACGYWYPGSHEASYASYRGEDIAGLDEHQHIEAYLGYVVRLEYAMSRGLVDARHIRSTLGLGLLWHTGFLMDVAATAVQQAQEYGAPPPDWARAVRVVHEQVALTRV
jgi:hypothetical protein